ncbi:glycine zipper 2TM domain-containing protein [Kaustia mangrovi]|uniref:Glycine zipper 2TM domain-containing protein n=1 Tax=Kaustia mangrovi TaxID=2593653 RepID=A0A7S8C2A0_9HYPH|nr:RT0821/Lpp0805 family surface protein [Kaustia mangrovi]QPC42070.1 glycine zipper 2TM domain-containing protein [Kaustia mangrovi]
MRGITVASVLALSLAVTGCANQGGWGPRQTTGTVVGGVAGGLLGSVAGGTTATAVGAALGAVLGSELGRQLDQQAQQQAYYATEQAVYTGRPQEWDYSRTGSHGRVVPGDTYRSSGRLCRDFSHTIYVEGRREVVHGTACQLADGSWRIVA